MPKFAYALPLPPERADSLRAVAAAIPVRRATEHRRYLRDHGIYKERWWLQSGAGTPAMSLVLWDCDDISQIGMARPHAEADHERWLATEVVEHVHGLEPATAELPETELLSGTTTRATATAFGQTLFALPIPSEGVDAVRHLVERIEHGDLSQAHSSFLTDASVREEWIWLQPAGVGHPPLLLIHWIGDDLEAAWQRLTFATDDPFARVLREALFTRLVGIAPDKAARWETEQLLVMHVRRSDDFDTRRRQLGRRVVSAVTAGEGDRLADLLAADVVLTDGGGHQVKGTSEVVESLTRLSTAGELEQTDVLIGTRHVLGLLTTGDGACTGLLLTVADQAVTRVQLLDDLQR